MENSETLRIIYEAQTSAVLSLLWMMSILTFFNPIFLSTILLIQLHLNVCINPFPLFSALYQTFNNFLFFTGLFLKTQFPPPIPYKYCIRCLSIFSLIAKKDASHNFSGVTCVTSCFSLNSLLLSRPHSYHPGTSHCTVLYWIPYFLDPPFFSFLVYYDMLVEHILQKHAEKGYLGDSSFWDFTLLNIYFFISLY